MISLFVLIIIVGIVGYFVVNKKDKIVLTNNSSNKTTSTEQQLPIDENNNESPIVSKEKKVITQQEKNEVDVKKLASFFVEMLGSYSSDANFKNIIDLKPMMTTKMQGWADNFIKSNLDNNANKDEFITTKVFSSKILSNNTNKIIVLVNSRRESSVNGEQKIYNQDANVVINKIGNNWLVDSVEWK